MGKKGKKSDSISDEIEIEFNIKKIINYKHAPLIILLSLSLIFNLYYFNANKAVWWDEAEYLSFAKLFGTNISYSMGENRAINYPIMLFLFSRIFSINEILLRIFLVAISLLTVFASYLFFNKAFNKKIAFLATLLLLTNYLYLFFQIRFLTEIPSLMFMLFGLYFFIDKQGNKGNLLTGLFIGLSIATRFTSFFILIPMVFYQILKKDKLCQYYWIFFIILGFIPTIVIDLIRGVIPVSEFFVMMNFNKDVPKTNPFYFIDAFGRMFGLLSIPFFIFGIITMAMRAKGKKQDFLKMSLVFLFFVIHFSFYSLMSAWKEERYMLNIIPFYYCIVSFGIFDAFSSFAKKFKKEYKLIAVFILALAIIIPNIQFGNLALIGKSESYIQVKQMSEFAQNIVPINHKIITNAPPQVSYYSGREIIGLPSDFEALEALLKNEDINLIILSAFEGIPEYVNEFNNAEKFRILNAGLIEDQAVVYVISYLND